MASTYTSNSGIQKPGSGEQAGAWGATVNTNFDILDRITGGVGSITLTGTTHTLTTTDGQLSDGHYKVLVLGGTPTGANTITISPNDQEKLYFVQNNSGQQAIFTQGTGGNATVNNGDTAIVYADGAGAGAQVTDFTNTLAAPTDLVNDTTPHLQWKYPPLQQWATLTETTEKLYQVPAAWAGHPRLQLVRFVL
jgi:hypothetical protein